MIVLILSRSYNNDGRSEEIYTMKMSIAVALASVLMLCFFVSGVSYATPSSYQASDVLGQADFSGNTAGSTANSLNGTFGSTALDLVHHRLFVSDTGNCRVLVYGLDANNNLVNHNANNVLGQVLTTDDCFSSAVVYYPTGLAYDSVNDRLFVGTYGYVQVFDFNNATITNNMSPSTEVGQADFGDSDCTVNAATMCGYNGGLAFDPEHELLFVNDGYDNSRILIFDVNPNTLHKGEDAVHVLGQSGFTTVQTNVSANRFNYPYYGGVVYDTAHHRLFVTDYFSDRVLVFDLSNGITDGMDASWVLGQETMGDSDPHLTQNGLGEVVGVGYDTVNQRLFVDDTLTNCRVLVFDLANGITSGMNASAVLGQPDFTTGDSASCTVTSQSQFQQSYANNMAFDPGNERLYFPDYTDNRVLIYNFIHVTNTGTPPPSSSVGASYSYTITAAGAQGTVSFAVTSGTLPPGLTLNATTGVISGTPTTSGTYTFEVNAYDNNGSSGTLSEDPTYTITVNAGAPNTGYGATGNLATLLTIGLFSGSIVLCGAGIKLHRATEK